MLKNWSAALLLIVATEGFGQTERRRESLSGPPIVTAKSWVIVDAKTGARFAGADADVARDMASTTKVMTALLVLELAERNPGVLDEEVVFSRRAAKTEGSSSKTGEGEKVLVRNLLYGLLLPSGNDAATAFAEHFGPQTAAARLAPKETDPLALFVAEMNRRGLELGLTKTGFANPHGLTNAMHKSSASDMAKLTLEALKRPLFRTVVGTVQFSGPVTTAAGGTRTATWKNTNQLLEFAQYYGVKTGTTTAAGSCLIAGGIQDGDDLLLVILGSSSNDARYADARNLFRWAWTERAKHGKSTSSEGFAPVIQR
jgi:D-alanyl-D-alanine carboxypeptidase (penicillin-binding protein 5/6)